MNERDEIQGVEIRMPAALFKVIVALSIVFWIIGAIEFVAMIVSLLT